MNDPQKHQPVCFNCKFWQNSKSFQYDCKFNGRWGGCNKFVNKNKKEEQTCNYDTIQISINQLFDKRASALGELPERKVS